MKITTSLPIIINKGNQVDPDLLLPIGRHLKSIPEAYKCLFVHQPLINSMQICLSWTLSMLSLGPQAQKNKVHMRSSTVSHTVYEGVVGSVLCTSTTVLVLIILCPLTVRLPPGIVFTYLSCCSTILHPYINHFINKLIQLPPSVGDPIPTT